MITSNIPSEAERIKELYRYELLDTENEKDLDDIVKLASKICNVPMSVISLIDVDRQWFKAKIGMSDKETSRSISFCSDAIKSNELMIIPDASQHQQYKSYSNVKGEPNIRFYAGMPLTTEGGYNLGTLCVIDTKPRMLDEEQTFALKVLGKQIIKLMELRLLNKKLQNSAAIQERIISILAHDIRNPLRSVKTLIEMHSDSMITNEKKDELLAAMPSRIENTLQMVSNLIEWGSLQMERNTTSEFELHQLVDNCIKTQQLQADLKHNKLVNSIKGEMIVTADKNEIDFILRNLISNAIKFTDNGIISVDGSFNNDKTTISVKDTGVGMDKQKLTSLFDADKNVITHGTKNEKGSGLGLKLIRERLDKNNGCMNIESQPGKGTCVSVSF